MAVEAPNIQTSKTSAARKLATCVEHAHQRMDPFRHDRLLFIKQQVGPYYGNRSVPGLKDPLAEPINTIASMVAVIVPHIFSGDALVEVSTQSGDPYIQAFRHKLRLAVNHALREIDFTGLAREVIVDALFGPAVIKTSLFAGPETQAGEGQDYLQDPGKVYCERVDMDDYFLDPNAKKRSALDFEGNLFEVSKADALSSGEYDTGELERLPTKSFESGGKATAAAVSQSESGPQGAPELVEHVRLASVWLAHENVIVDVPADPRQTQGFLRESPYEGPEGGPYDMLGFQYPPNSPIPIAPVGMVYDLHEVINALGRKIKRQAEREKTVLGFDGPEDKGARNIQSAGDGDIVRVPDVNRMKEFSFGGVDPKNYQSVAWFLEQHSRMAGNLDLMGGLAPQSKTLGQDQMLYETGSVRVNDARNTVRQVLRKVVRKVAWYVWTDPVLALSAQQDLGGGLSVPVRWDPQTREGDFLDYNFDIDAYAMVMDSPEQQYLRMLDIIERVLVPLLPMLMQQGMAPDGGKILGTLAQKRNLPDLTEWLMAAAPMAAPMPAGGMQGPNRTTNINLGGGRGKAPPSVTQTLAQGA